MWGKRVKYGWSVDETVTTKHQEIQGCQEQRNLVAKRRLPSLVESVLCCSEARRLFWARAE